MAFFAPLFSTISILVVLRIVYFTPLVAATPLVVGSAPQHRVDTTPADELTMNMSEMAFYASRRLHSKNLLSPAYLTFPLTDYFRRETHSAGGPGRKILLNGR